VVAVQGKPGSQSGLAVEDIQSAATDNPDVPVPAGMAGSAPPHGVKALPLATLLRVAGHCLIWIVVLVPTLIQLNRGWRPVGDGAQMTARSLEVLSRNPPLVGMQSSAFSGVAHPPSDLGPLLFWLLAIPVHVDVATGILWGAAVLDALVLSLALAAAYRARLWVGAFLAVAFAADLAWRIPSIFFAPDWNPHIGLVFLAASVIFAYVVASGSKRWWPVLVITGSVAAQCHLAFVLPAALLVVGAPIYGLVTKNAWNGNEKESKSRPPGWFWAGVVVGAFSWAPTVIQEVIGHPGNVSTLLHDKGKQKSLGVGFGLRSLATAISPLPLWLRPPSIRTFPSPGSAEAAIDGHSAVIGLFGLLALAILVFGSVKSRQRGIAGLSIVTLLTAVGSVGTYASTPAGIGEAGPLTYLVPMLWLMSMVWWFVCAWTLFWLVRRYFERRTTSDSIPAGESVEVRTSAARGLRPVAPVLAIGLCLLLLIPTIGAIASVSQPPAQAVVSLDQDTQVRDHLDTLVKRGPVELVVPPSVDEYVDEAGISLYLRSLGRTVDLSQKDGSRTDGLNTPVGAHWAEIAAAPNVRAVWTCAGHPAEFSRFCSSQLDFSYAAGCGQRAGPSYLNPGYFLYNDDGTVDGFGSDSLFPDLVSRPDLNPPVVSTVSTPGGLGHWMTDADGGVAISGNAGFYGSMSGRPLNKRVVGMTCMPGDKGYWLVAADGGIFAFGDAPFYGSTGGLHLDQPIVGVTSTRDGNGYWIVGAEGEVFSFGDAGFYGSTSGKPLSPPIVGIASTSDGKGYWLVAADGGVFAFGDARFYGSMSGRPLNRPMVGMVPTADGNGYWLVAADGGIFAFGDAPFEGSLGARRISGIIGASP